MGREVGEVGEGRGGEGRGGNQESGIRNILLSPMAGNIKYNTVYRIHVSHKQNNAIN